MKTAIEVEKKLRELRLNREENKEKIEILNWVFYPSTPLLTKDTLLMYTLYLEGKSFNEIGQLFGINLQLVRKYVVALQRLVRQDKIKLGLPVEESVCSLQGEK